MYFPLQINFSYDQIFAEALPIEEVEGDKPAQKQKR